MLFKATTEIQQYLELDSNVNFASLKSSIRAAEKDILIPVIGLSFYLDLDSKYTAGTLSVKEKALIDVIQAALAAHAIYLYVPKSEVNITDGGVRRNETDTSKTAFQYQVTNLRAALLGESEKAVEYLITFLELKKADYPVWTSTAEFKRYRSLFIKTGSELNEFYGTASPGRNYMAMRSVMEDIEQQVIKKMLGDNQFKVLKAKDQLNDPVWSDYENMLMYRLKKCIANLTIAAAIGKLAVRIDDYGITVTSAFISTSNDQVSKRGAAADNQISQLAREAKAAGETWLNDAVDYLRKNAGLIVFPQWYEWQLSLALVPEEHVNERIGFCLRQNGSFSLF